MQDAVIRNLMVIGEAVKLIPVSQKEEHPDMSNRGRLQDCGISSSMHILECIMKLYGISSVPKFPSCR